MGFFHLRLLYLLLMWRKLFKYFHFFIEWNSKCNWRIHLLGHFGHFNQSLSSLTGCWVKFGGDGTATWHNVQLLTKDANFTSKEHNPDLWSNFFPQLARFKIVFFVSVSIPDVWILIAFSNVFIVFFSRKFRPRKLHSKQLTKYLCIFVQKNRDDLIYFSIKKITHKFRG